MRRTVVAHAPARLDFGGGWTDVPPYPENRGGFVCNLAIERRARVTLEARADAPAATEGAPPRSLSDAACRAARVTGVDVSLESDFPVGAGLGGSSAAGVALAAALHAWTGTPSTPAALAEWSREVEVSGLGMPGGRQDHYAAAFGGALALSFGETVDVRRLILRPAACDALERRLILMYTGESRLSGETITAVLDAYNDRDSHVVEALSHMKVLARQMADALEQSDIDALGRLVQEHWLHQRSLHPRITTARIDAIESAATRAGALGMKALGASGGGCVMVIAPDDRVDTVTAAIAEYGELLPWRVAHSGVIVEG